MMPPDMRDCYEDCATMLRQWLLAKSAITIISRHYAMKIHAQLRHAMLPRAFDAAAITMPCRRHY